MPLQLAECHVVCSFVGSADEVGYGFCLREIHLAVEECTLSELAWTGRNASVLGEQEHHLLQYVGGAVAGDFY